MDVDAQVSLFGVHVESPFQPMDALSRNLRVCGPVAAVRNQLAAGKEKEKAETTCQTSIPSCTTAEGETGHTALL